MQSHTDRQTDTLTHTHTQLRLEFLTTLPVQVDGEAWPQPPGYLTVTKLPTQAKMLLGTEKAHYSRSLSKKETVLKIEVHDRGREGGKVKKRGREGGREGERERRRKREREGGKVKKRGREEGREREREGGIERGIPATLTWSCSLSTQSCWLNRRCTCRGA